MSKTDKLHVAFGVIGVICLLIVAGWAQWGAQKVPDGPNDYTNVVDVIKWTCLFLSLGMAYLVRLIRIGF